MQPLSSERLLGRCKRGARMYRSIYNKDQVVGTSKDYSWLKRTRHLKLMNLVLFYIWEDAKLWAHWDYSFDKHFGYLGPVSCAFSFWVSSGCTVGGCLQWLMAASCFYPEFPQGSPSGQLQCEGLMATTSFVYWYGRQHFFIDKPFCFLSLWFWQLYIPHISGIIQYLSSSVQIISVNKMPSRSIQPCCH